MKVALRDVKVEEDGGVRIGGKRGDEESSGEEGGFLVCSLCLVIPVDASPGVVYSSATFDMHRNRR